MQWLIRDIEQNGKGTTAPPAGTARDVVHDRDGGVGGGLVLAYSQHKGSVEFGDRAASQLIRHAAARSTPESPLAAGSLP